MAATPKRRHSTRRTGKRRAARVLELTKKLKKLNPKSNKHLRSLTSNSA